MSNKTLPDYGRWIRNPFFGQEAARQNPKTISDDLRKTKSLIQATISPFLPILFLMKVFTWFQTKGKKEILETTKLRGFPKEKSDFTKPVGKKYASCYRTGCFCFIAQKRSRRNS